MLPDLSCLEIRGVRLSEPRLLKEGPAAPLPKEGVTPTDAVSTVTTGQNFRPSKILLDLC